MNIYSNSLIFFKFLERFEKKCHEITNRNDLVEIFCNDIIPKLAKNEIIATLRDEWRNQRDQISKKVHEAEIKALKETITIFKKVKESIRSSNNKKIIEKIAVIDNLITNQGKIYGNPLYRIIYQKLKQLFCIILEAGHKELCKNYAKLSTYKKYVQKDSDQKETRAIQEKGKTPKILNDDKLSKAKLEGLSLVSIPVDYELVEETYIEEFLFAPSVIKAYAAMDAIHWDNVRNPAIVWWYFESALWCWQTPEIYFDQFVNSKKKKDQYKQFQIICEKSAWQEIAIVRDSLDIRLTPIIFTENLFKIGLTTIIDEIGSYLFQGKEKFTKSILSPTKNMIFFELRLDGNELWTGVTFENNNTKKFYIQKFNEGIDGEGSLLFRFIKDIIKEPSPGEKKANLSFPSESASKHINRIRLPDALKRSFFGKSSRVTFQFKGIKIALNSSSKETKLILNKLRENHLKCYN